MIGNRAGTPARHQYLYRDSARQECHVASPLRKSVAQSIALSAVVRSELLAGALLSAKPDENRRIAEEFCALFPCLPFDANVADIHAEWHVRLRNVGTSIGVKDLMIAATALTHNLAVVTHNTDEFRRINGLAIEDWQDE